VTLPSPFALPYSRFNAFLFASIGEDGNGMPLSVVSALARLDIDPWQEAARLSDLPKTAAAAALDGLIRRLPAGRWDSSDTRKIAARLIELLPRSDLVVRHGGAEPRGRAKARSSIVLWLIVLALGGYAIFGMSVSWAPRWGDHGASTPISDGSSWETGPQ
jgi:hypothetical protein